MDMHKMASDRGITLIENDGIWTASFGTEHLMSTTMPKSLFRFFDECELVHSGRFECLKISGFIEHVRDRA